MCVINEKGVWWTLRELNTGGDFEAKYLKQEERKKGRKNDKMEAVS